MDKPKYNYVNLKGAKCPLDLGDGSERAEYVNQDYIINELGKPHRCVNIMYTYYPNDEFWPARISEACKDMDVTYAWDYPYDDYFPYGANGEPFNQMKDIRRHGQDIMLTLTMDTKVSDEQLRQLGKDLRPFGRMRLRINHECDGTWFTHNKRNSYQEIGDFFARASKLIKEEAPNVKTVFCAGMIEEDRTETPYASEFSEAYKECDIYSCDRYMALNYGWPYDVANPGGGRYYAKTVDEVYKTFTDTKDYLTQTFGDKPLILGEFNTDGDVTGGFKQPDSIVKFYERLASEDAKHLAGISMYQFRDRGRLGLELEDPNNSTNGIKQPLFYAYRKIMNMPYFMPQIEAIEDVDGKGTDNETCQDNFFPASTRWGGAEDATGIQIVVDASKTEEPTFFEITFDVDNALMIEIMGKWFYKAPDVRVIDLMPAFYEAQYEGRIDELLDAISENGGVLKVNVFATPRDGVNPDSDKEGCNINYYDVIENEPIIRLLYEPCEVVE